ncbi:TIR domain-containing protein [Thermogemmatispora sp.]|uniref:TIR domain-containing protein n=1 Tax=Thermogemmatispora sp. TaxID=1968838 RepID=UPI0035E43D1A
MEPAASPISASQRQRLAIYISYADSDRNWAERIKRRVRLAASGAGLEPPQVQEPGQFLAGSDVQRARQAALQSADLILLLISSDFLDSPECLSDMEAALERRRRQEVVLVPIIVRPVAWEHTPLGQLEALPPGRPPKALTRWHKPDEGLYRVEEGLRRLFVGWRERLRSQEAVPFTPEQEQALRAMLIDHRPFIGSRLAGFVGRQAELAAIRRHIAELQPVGGYLIISGQAGQGKSSLIARLVQEEGLERVPHHFLPLDPPLDHSVALLRDLLARLILGWRLDPTPLLVAGTSRAALATALANLLQELSERGERLLICIDGLDQLPREAGGKHHLGFLPSRLPPGCLIVLGSRPNDALQLLHLRGPVREYSLPPLSRADFEELLQAHGLQLAPIDSERLYALMEPNTLYLDLIVRELERDPGLTPEALSARLSSDPEALFTLAIERLKEHPLWERLIYPLLGLLLVAREPLEAGQLGQILGGPEQPVATYQVRDALQQLGGLLVADSGGRYSLYHLKLRHYLRQDPEQPDRSWLFTASEEARWHALMAAWCERGGSEQLWQEASYDPAEEARRRYARRHLPAHLFHGRRWEGLFALLDAGHYGYHKIRQLDPSTWAYASDLDLGRRAAAWAGWDLATGLAQLPRLWRYTLLRCSLSSQAERYPPEAFALLVQLGRRQEALGLADLLSEPGHQLEALVAIARQLQEQGAPASDYRPLYWRACDVARAGSEPERLAPLLSELAAGLYRAGWRDSALQLWRAAIGVARRIASAQLCAEALLQIAQGLAEAGQSDEIEEIIEAMPAGTLQNEVRLTLLAVLAQARRWPEAEAILTSLAEPAGSVRAEALAILAREQERAGLSTEAQRRWQQAEGLACAQPSAREQARALVALVRALVACQHWSEAERLCDLIPEQWQQSEARLSLTQALAAAGDWKRAIASSERMADDERQAEAQLALVEALAEAARWTEAEALCAHIALPQPRLQALIALGQARAERGQLEQAREHWQQVEASLVQLEHADEQSATCVALGQALARAGLLSEAQRCWQQAEAILRTLPAGKEQAADLALLTHSLLRHGRWQEASQVAQAIGDWEQRAEALIASGRALYQAGQPEAAARCWQQVVSLVHTQARQSEQYSAILSLLAGSATTPATWDEAERTIRSLAQGRERGQALAILGRLQAQTGAWERARQLWREAEELIAHESMAWGQADGYQALARELAQAGEWQEAERIVRRIPEGWERADAQALLGKELVGAGRLEEAERLSQAIAFPRQRVEALLALGKGWLQTTPETAEQEQAAERRRRAEHCWQESERLIASMDVVQRAELFARLGEALAAVGERERAHSCWQQSERCIASLAGEWGQAEALATLCETLINSQEWQEAERLLPHIPHSWREATLRARLAAALAEAGHWDEAARLCRTIGPETERAQALAALGQALARAGQRAQARQSWDEVRRSAETIPDEEGQAQVLLALGQALSEVGAHEELLRLVQWAWSRVSTREQALRLFPLVGGLLELAPELGLALGAAFAEVESFLTGAWT